MSKTQDLEAGGKLPQPGRHPDGHLDEEQGVDALSGRELVQRKAVVGSRRLLRLPEPLHRRQAKAGLNWQPPVIPDKSCWAHSGICGFFKTLSSCVLKSKYFS